MTWSGLYTPLITPFKNGKVDEEGLASLIHFQRKNHVTGLVLLGTTAEAATLTFEEKKQILLLGKKEAPDLPIIAGVVANSTWQAIELAQLAEKCGADAALVITPFYNKPTQEGIFRHYEAIVNETDLPIFLYNIPGRTGVNIELATLKKIVELPRIVGMKESSKDLLHAASVIAQIKYQHPSFTLLAGEDSLLLPFMALGAEGAIPSIANLVPHMVYQIIRDALHHNYMQARRTYYELLPLIEALSSETNPIALKYAMGQCALPSGIPRLPLTPLSPVFHEKIHEALDLLRLPGGVL